MTVPCPICRGDRTRAAMRAGARALHRCSSCGAAYVWPQPTRLAQQEVAERAAAQRLPRERRPEVIDRIGVHNAEILGYLAARGCAGTLLDIGCGRGILLAHARARGWEVTGVEPARCIAEEGMRERGLDIRAGTLEDAGLPAASFDAVIFSHSLEHLIDPAGTMRIAAGLMKPGGWIYIETPAWGSLSRRLLGRRWWNVDLDNHLFLFSPRAIALLGRRAGLASRDSWGTHFDAAAVLIRLAHCFDPALNDIARINDRRERLFRVRGAWRISRILDSAAAALLGRGFLNDYMVCWLQKPGGDGMRGDAPCR